MGPESIWNGRLSHGVGRNGDEQAQGHIQMGSSRNEHEMRETTLEHSKKVLAAIR